jgi:hypothetical protein
MVLKGNALGENSKINFREIFGADRFSTFATVDPRVHLRTTWAARS